ncbi:MAG: hypothetical protein AAGD96_33895, partial [Chloroflexota bacterium]
KRRKRIRFDRLFNKTVSPREVFRSFGITFLMIVNVTLLCATIVWFGLILSVFTPAEFTKMMVGEASKAVPQFESTSSIPPAPKLSK